MTFKMIADLVAIELQGEREPDLKTRQGERLTHLSFAMAHCHGLEPAEIIEGRRHVEAGWTVTESPLEAMLLPYLVFQTYAGIAHPLPIVKLPGSSDTGRVVIEPQREVSTPEGGFRFDFLVTGRWEGREASVIVECDGADYHAQKRREDWDRDEHFRRHGIPTVRAEGRRILADPADIAHQVAQHLVRKLMGGAS